MKNIRKPLSIYILFILMAFQGLSGFVGGYGLIKDPTGGLLKLPLSLLHNSPFDDYLIPGLILLIILGYFPLVIAFGLWKQKYVAWIGSLITGVSLLIWNGTQVFFIGYLSEPPLQFLYGILALLVLSVALLPSVRGHFKIKRMVDSVPLKKSV